MMFNNFFLKIVEKYQKNKRYDIDKVILYVPTIKKIRIQPFSYELPVTKYLITYVI